MVSDRYVVIKDIDEGWECGAKVGDILEVRMYEGYETLFKGGKAVCDMTSAAQVECCKAL